MTGKGSALARLSYAALSKKMATFSNEDLVRLMDTASVKVGDTATSLLSENGAQSLVVQAVDRDLIKTRNGKMRVAHILAQDGAEVSGATNVLLRLVTDRVFDVATSALFALVKMGGEEAKVRLKEILSRRDVSPKVIPEVLRAIEAIDKKDVRIFSPDFGG